MATTFRNTRTQPVNTFVYGKIPPQAIDLEEAVIGACLLEKDTFNSVISIIPRGDCFYTDHHQKIYGAMVGMIESGMPIDLLTVTEYLSRRGELEAIGGAYALTKLTISVLSTAHVEAHACIVMEKYFGRELIRIGMQMVNDAYEDSSDVLGLIETSKAEIDGITKDMDAGGDMHIGRLYAEMVTKLEYQKGHRTALTGLDTGLYDLNEITNGWQNSDLIIIGARPSKGKTALALNLALSAAISQLVNSVPVGFFSLEMGGVQLVKRMAATVSGIDFKKIMSGNLTDDEFVMISQKSRYFNSLPIRIADRVFTMLKLCALARKWKEKHNVGLLVIDYLQLIRGIKQQGGNREQEVSSITRDLKLLAKELDIPIILLSQLNRNVESRGSAEPTPADLRESGAIEQDADVILFPWHGEDDSFISIAKNRNGETAIKDRALKIKFSGSIQKWMNPEAFEPFKDKYVPENVRAGITNNYQKDKEFSRWDDEPFT